MDEMLGKLIALGTNRVSHINGSLLAHLRGVYDLLKKWGSREAVCKAGLFHSIYGTEGFAPQMVSLRQEIVEIIGEEAEQLVHYFATCDRDHFYSQIGEAEVEHRNRLSGEVTVLKNETLRDLLELTLANELEIMLTDKNLVQVYRNYSWEDIFDRFEGFVSPAGFRECVIVFGRIPGVKIVSLKLLPNEKGRLMEVQRNDDKVFPGFGQAYITSTRSGIIKAWYLHRSQIDQIASVTGKFLLVLFDSRTGVLMKIIMGESDPKLVQIPPGVWHGFKNIGDQEGFLLHLNTVPYNFESPDEERLDLENSIIPFDW